MKIELRELQKKDEKYAILFAIKGLHLDWYFDNKLLLNLYGRYVWYKKLSGATQVIPAYVGERMVGVLLAQMKGEEKSHKSLKQNIYVALFSLFQKKFLKDDARIYEETIQRLHKEYQKQNAPDGEITFLVVDSKVKVKGVGSMLLLELEKREPGKTVFLHTDDACEYQFYEKRGFERVCEYDIVVDKNSKKVPLKCFIVSKKNWEG